MRSFTFQDLCLSCDIRGTNHPLSVDYCQFVNDMMCTGILFDDE